MCTCNFSHADRVMDFIPFVSTVNNGVEAITNVALSVMSLFTPGLYKDIQSNHTISHIDNKSLIASLFMMIPGFNIVAALAHHHIDEEKGTEPWFLSKLITRIDVVMDFIPGTSQSNNIACLVAKLALAIFKFITPRGFEWLREHSHIVRHLDNKHALVSVLMTVPMANIVIAALYHFGDKNYKESLNRTIVECFTIQAIFSGLHYLFFGRRRA